VPEATLCFSICSFRFRSPRLMKRAPHRPVAIP
jgi:hypothetical protein